MSTDSSLNKILSARLPGYEHRAGQQSMSRAVADALAGGVHLMVEAGTGTGKSLAYLMPLAEHALSTEARTAVSTYTKALQRQLVEKDLPFVKKHVFADLRFCVSFGSENYMCLRRLGQATTYGLFEEATEEVSALVDWSRRTVSGLRHEVVARPALWGKVSRQSDMCRGRDCRYFSRCFYQLAKVMERSCHIVVVNHHLYFTDMATGGRVLPGFQCVVFDEAHELEDVAAAHLGVEISNFSVLHLCDSVLSARGKGLLGGRMGRHSKSDGLDRVSAALQVLRAVSANFFGELDGWLDGPSRRVRDKFFIEDTLGQPLRELAAGLEFLGRGSSDEDEKFDIAAITNRCTALAAALQAILAQELEGHVYYAERAGRALRLKASPVDVAPTLRAELFGGLDTAVLTSATLATGGQLDYMKGRLGAEDATALVLESPFQYQHQALTYIASDLPEPGSAEYEAGLIGRVAEILEITGGGTLVLFTSHRLLGMAAEAVQDRVKGIELMRQGEADSYALIERLRGGGQAAIFGTHTFWQGVDVPGPALQCVIITKLPFAVPDEPMVEARMESLSRRGLDPFNHYQIPRAAILLKQGFGRLIRTSTDRGVVAILDPRILSRGYGKHFLNSLPTTATSRNLKSIKDFLHVE